MNQDNQISFQHTQNRDSIPPHHPHRNGVENSRAYPMIGPNNGVERTERTRNSDTGSQIREDTHFLDPNGSTNQGSEQRQKSKISLWYGLDGQQNGNRLLGEYSSSSSATQNNEEHWSIVPLDNRDGATTAAARGDSTNSLGAASDVSYFSSDISDTLSPPNEDDSYSDDNDIYPHPSLSGELSVTSDLSKNYNQRNSTGSSTGNSTGSSTGNSTGEGKEFSKLSALSGRRSNPGEHESTNGHANGCSNDRRTTTQGCVPWVGNPPRESIMPKITLRFINPDKKENAAAGAVSNSRQNGSFSVPASPRYPDYCMSASPPSDVPIDADRQISIDDDKYKRFQLVLERYMAYIKSISTGKPRHSYPTYPMQQQYMNQTRDTPTVSYGIILIHVENDANNERQSSSIDAMTHAAAAAATSTRGLRTSSGKKKIQYFLCHRRDTIEYANFIRGAYEPEDIYSICSLMSLMERQKITLFPFEKLWEDYRPIGRSKYHAKYYQQARQKYEQIKPFIADFFACTTSQIKDTEWMFPRGRKDKISESDMETAEKEFLEETTIARSLISPLPVHPIMESYRGSNGTLFQTIYYVYIAADKIEPQYTSTGSIREQSLSNDFTRCKWYYLSDLDSVLNKRRYTMMTQVEEQIRAIIDN